jgi:hypothetical protein
MRSLTLLFLLLPAATVLLAPVAQAHAPGGDGAASPRQTGGTGPSATDEDGDGVANTDDKCAHTNPLSEKPIDADGCGPFRASATLFARDTKEMQDDPDVHGQCVNAKGLQCTFHLTLTLSKASAKRLHVKRNVMDVTFKTDKSTMAGKYVYNKKSGGLTRAATRAFKRAYDGNIPVTMTFAGTYASGSGDTQLLPNSTFTMKRKPPGGTAYRIEPNISNGPEGPSSTGLTRPPSKDDF